MKDRLNPPSPEDFIPRPWVVEPSTPKILAPETPVTRRRRKRQPLSPEEQRLSDIQQALRYAAWDRRWKMHQTLQPLADAYIDAVVEESFAKHPDAFKFNPYDPL